VARNAAVLRALVPRLSFNDGRYIEADAVVTLALSASGLARLGLPADAMETFPAAFRLGMRGEGRDRILGDDGSAAGWWWDTAPVDAALLVYGDTVEAVARLVTFIDEQLVGAGTLVDQIDLAPVHGQLVDRKEPFGFVDGVSQPAIRGTYRGLRNADPIHLVEPGEIILGYPDNRGGIPPGPWLDARYDPDMMLPIAGDTHGFTDTIKSNPRLIGFNGSYLVIRQLEQDHDGFWAYCHSQADKFATRFPAPAICDAEFIAAKMIGRWKDGSSLTRNPYMSATRLKEIYGSGGTAATMREAAAPANPDASPVQPGDRVAAEPRAAVRPPQPDNDFLFGTEDPQGLRCPYGAHVRRANPRDSFSPGSMEQVEITNRHRILRIGRGFVAQPGRQAGLMFMCLNADIERQFEFIQQSWMGSTKFHGLDAETDPIAVTGRPGTNGFTVPVRTGPVALAEMPRFVTVRGGGYFFVPGRQLLRYLASGTILEL
jgi:Dyp-type peroxidase family